MKSKKRNTHKTKSKITVHKNQSRIDDDLLWTMNICHECGDYFKPNSRYPELLICGKCSQYIVPNLSARMKRIEDMCKAWFKTLGEMANRKE